MLYAIKNVVKIDYKKGGLIINIEETETLKTILEDKNNKETIVALLEELLKEKIKEIQTIETKNLDSMEEYGFSLIKMRAVLDNDKYQTIYLKTIRGGKVKETIFCYWSLLYEEYLNKDKYNTSKIIPKKVNIAEKSIKKDKKSIVLTVNRELEFSTKIDLIELRNFVIEMAKDNKILEKFIKDLDENDILFLATIE